MSLSDSQFYYKFLDDSNSDDWNYLLCNSDDVGFFHDIQLNNYYQEKEGAKNISFLVYIKDQKIPVAGCPLYMIKENSNKFYSHCCVLSFDAIKYECLLCIKFHMKIVHDSCYLE